jgi:predicted RNA-binding protein with PUA-like domain
MKKGDLALIYHTGEQRQAVGVAEITSAPYADPKGEDERHVVVDLKPKRKLKRPITLDEIKADPAFAGWDLLRISRLSVVPVPEPMWKRLEELSAMATTA